MAPKPWLLLGGAALSLTTACGGAVVPLYDTSSLPLTAASSTVSFVVCSDTRSRARPWEPNTEVVRRKLITKVVSLKPAFVINTGDLISYGSFDWAWAVFDEEYAPLREAGIRYVPALGNHEYVGVNQTALEKYFARFPQVGGRKYYSWDAGPLRILVLDSNFNDLGEEQRAWQRSWLESELRRADRDPSVQFVMLADHHPMYSNAERPGDPLVEQDFVAPARASKKARMILSGHAHSYERFEVNGFTYVVSGGCGAPLRTVKAKPEEWRHQPAYNGPESRGHHYLDCTVSSSKLRCTVNELDPATDTWKSPDFFELRPP